MKNEDTNQLGPDPDEVAQLAAELVAVCNARPDTPLCTEAMAAGEVIASVVYQMARAGEGESIDELCREVGDLIVQGREQGYADARACN
ncbi:MAG TPA: hypothetical protein DDW52_23305 [Planctomycetaceae bacterium]|nr:hypothetical protein [Planctomycetaceae bacterium]